MFIFSGLGLFCWSCVIICEIIRSVCHNDCLSLAKEEENSRLTLRNTRAHSVACVYSCFRISTYTCMLLRVFNTWLYFHFKMFWTFYRKCSGLISKYKTSQVPFSILYQGLKAPSFCWLFWCSSIGRQFGDFCKHGKTVRRQSMTLERVFKGDHTTDRCSGE